MSRESERAAIPSGSMILRSALPVVSLRSTTGHRAAIPAGSGQRGPGSCGEAAGKGYPTVRLDREPRSSRMEHRKNSPSSRCPYRARLMVSATEDCATLTLGYPIAAPLGF